MAHRLFAIALTVSLGGMLADRAHAAPDPASCDNVRQQWLDRQSGNQLVGAVTATDVSDGPLPGATPLNTASWALYVPAVSVKWPNTPMRIDLGTPSAPVVDCEGPTLSVTTTVHLAFSALPIGQPQAAAFTLAVPFSYVAALRFDPSHPFRWTTSPLTIGIVSTAVGPIDLSLLQGLDLRPYLGLAHL